MLYTETHKEKEAWNKLERKCKKANTENESTEELIRKKARARKESRADLQQRRTEHKSSDVRTLTFRLSCSFFCHIKQKFKFHSDRNPLIRI
jgi:predicted RNase H-like nuclease (RuvC/YqgF family)